MNLNNKVSRADVERVNDIRNHPTYESGFDDDMFGDDSSGGGGDMFDGMDGLFGDDSSSSGFDSFGSSNDSFGGFGNDSFGGGSSFGGGGFGNDSFGGSGFGGNSFGGGGFGGGGFNSGFATSPFGDSAFGGGGQQQALQQQKPDLLDSAANVGAEAAKSLGNVLTELVKSLKFRTADDFGYLSRNMILTGAVALPVGIIMGITGVLAKISMLSFTGMGLHTTFSGALLLTVGTAGIGTASLILSKQGEATVENTTVDMVPDEPMSSDNVTDEYEENLGGELDDLFGDDFDELFNSLDNGLDGAEPDEPLVDDEKEELPEIDVIDYKQELDNIKENTYVSRQSLFDTFKRMLPTNTPKFADTKSIDENSDDFKQLETICLKALANLANCELEEVGSQLESAEESMFSYKLMLKRINKVKKTDDLAREIEVYMRDDSSDDSVNATVTIEGDFYKILVTKGETAVVTFGDVFKLNYCCDFFTNTKNQLPIIAGIDELGNVLLEDAKSFDTMLICGRPRSGKSWYVLSVLMCLILFNTPDTVQFIIVDPKESNLFKTMALLPHVCGLHNDKYILDILADVIEVEAPRRKKLLADHRCDDIWALRKKGINLPVLYIVIDEYITVVGNLDKEKGKEFDTKIRTIISQLPSLGIRLVIIPHRPTGIVDKTNRTMIQFTAAVRSENKDVEEALGVNKWDRALTKPGDIAIKTSSMKSAKYARGSALTTDDGANSEFIETAAKAFYKMGIDMPDMSNMKIACNRDEAYIRDELEEDTTRLQYDATKIKKDLDECLDDEEEDDYKTSKEPDNKPLNIWG